MEQDPTQDKKVMPLAETAREKLVGLEEQLQFAAARESESQTVLQELLDSIGELARLADEEYAKPEEMRDEEMLQRIEEALPEFEMLALEQVRIADNFFEKAKELREKVQRIKPHVERVEAHTQKGAGTENQEENGQQI